MTPEAQRIAIAEACGWTDVHLQDDGHLYGKPPKEHYYSPNVPSYLSDLNAMHEAEKVLTDDQLWMYRRKLSCLFADHTDDGYLKAIFATAAQRAEAFGLTLNLWTPSD